MSTATFGLPIKEFKGETKTLSTTAAVVAAEPGFQEVILYCASQWRLALAPRLQYVLYYTAASSTFTNYTPYALDKSSSTHVPLDSMLATDFLYLGFSGKTRGCYFNIGTNVQDEAATLDVEYGSGQSTTITAAVAAAATSCTVSSATGFPGTAFTALLGSETVTVSNVVGTTVTMGAVTYAHGIGEPFVCMFHDIADDSDGTDVGGDTLKQDGAYTWTLPTTWLPTFPVNKISSNYWIRFKPSATLDAATDIDEIIPYAAVASYAYMEAGVAYNFSLNIAQVGAMEVLASAGTPTLDISWIKH